ncbi:PEP-CTERM sorting domain-containing protein [Pseudoduganella sp. FT55W]|uniref:PEP-CTERM sorting domain-containing protein n=1 Tax=Duganella rivi TaxID=2666083 RepID=A0A7X4KAM7_9BURK|nr:PEP-CTERM sorting domain-containing protein [Duganella rivi]MYM65438.1 PEP-CTERM sorting domain-containing protein [Duganella rivi]
MKLYKFLHAALLAGLMCSAQAADYAKFGFTAAVSTILVDGKPITEDVITIKGKELRLGDSIKGTFSFSTVAPVWMTVTPDIDLIYKDLGYSEFSSTSGLAFGDYLAPQSSQFRVVNGGAPSSADSLSFTFTPYQSDAERATFLFSDPTGSSLNSPSLPLDLNLNKFATHSLRYAIDSGVGQIELVAEVAVLRNLSPVPEPSTYAMLLAGLCLTTAIARRKRPAARVAVGTIAARAPVDAPATFQLPHRCR